MDLDYEIPNNWDICQVSEISDVSLGKTPKKNDYCNSGTKKIIKFRDVTQFGVDWQNSEKGFVLGEAIGDLKQLQENDVLITASAHSSDHIGKKIAHVSKLPQEYEIVFYVGELLCIRACTEAISSKYIFYYFQSRAGYKTLQYHVKGVHLTSGEARKMEMPIAPLNEQHRIVAKIEALFSELEKGIESFKAAREQLKLYRQALLKRAFSGKLTEQWRTENSDKLESAETLLQRIQSERQQRYQQQLKDWEANGKPGSKPKAPKVLPPLTAEELALLPELPIGWSYFKVDQMCDVVRGGSPRPAGDPKFYGGNIPFLKVADLTNTATPYLSSFKFTITEAGLSKTRQIEPNTLLLSNSGATLGVPKICLISATMNDGVAAFLGLAPESLLYHYYFWQSKTEFLRNIDQGAAQPNLNTDLIKETIIPLCSASEQMVVIEKLEAAFSALDQLGQTITTALQQAEALRQSILKKAFSGQLVPQDPNDEPASVLLERIQAEKAAQAAQSKPKKTPKRKATT